MTHVARLVSIGQLPSGRTEFVRKRTPCSITSQPADAGAGRGSSQRHHDEAGQRRRFEIAAARGLNSPQHLQTHAASASRRTTFAQRIPRPAMLMHALADGDQRRQRITDDRQPHEAKPRLRQARQLERQRAALRPTAPGPPGHTSSGSAPRTCGPCRSGGESPRPVPRASCRLSRSDTPRLSRWIHCSSLSVKCERRPAQHRCRDVRETLDGVAPAAVGVLMFREPADPAVDQLV